jgi:PIN domain nuclease of toxin-antitoxin system
MTYLLDTHILIWYISGNSNLSSKIIEMIDNPKNLILVSKVVLWEIVIKRSIGKLEMGISFSALEAFLLSKDFSIIDFEFNDLNELLNLPYHHRDPFDRILISQAIANNWQIISDDSKFKLYPVQLLT